MEFDYRAREAQLSKVLGRVVFDLAGDDPGAVLMTIAKLRDATEACEAKYRRMVTGGVANGAQPVAAAGRATGRATQARHAPARTPARHTARPAARRRASKAVRGARAAVRGPELRGRDVASAAQLLASVRMPRRIAALPQDRRGYPVPRFVMWFHGVPDFRIVDTPYVARAVRHKLCWICGEPLGRMMVFAIGPMCVITRVSSEPPSHFDCADYAARVCPFLAIPNTHRTPSRNQFEEAPGFMIMRNPGVIALWITRSYEPFDATTAGGMRGALFRLGEPEACRWYCEGRAALPDEVTESIRAGMPNLIAAAKRDRDPAGAMHDLMEQVLDAEPLLPGGRLPADLVA